jgi:hypothetical protein
MVEVAGIEPVRTVWNHREPLVSRTNSPEPGGPVGTRWVRRLTPSTANRAGTRDTGPGPLPVMGGRGRGGHSPRLCLERCVHDGTGGQDRVLEIEGLPEAAIDLAEQHKRREPGLLGEVSLVEGDDCGDVHDGVSG